MLGTDRILYINGLKARVKKQTDNITYVRFEIIAAMLETDAELVSWIKVLLAEYY
jgi:hypothetical protein